MCALLWELGYHIHNMQFANTYHLHAEGTEDLPVEEYLPILCGCTEADVYVQWIAPRTDELRHVISHALLSNYDYLSTGDLTEQFYSFRIPHWSL